MSTYRLLRSKTLGSPSGKTVGNSFSIYIPMFCAHHKHESTGKLHSGVLGINIKNQSCFAAKHLEALRAKQFRIPSLYI